MSSVFVKVPVSDRLPDYCKTKTFIDKSGRTQDIAIDDENSVYYCSDRTFSNISVLKSKYDYWLEEIQLPTEEEIREQSKGEIAIVNDGCEEFISGANFIINHIKKGGSNGI